MKGIEKSHRIKHRPVPRKEWNRFVERAKREAEEVIAAVKAMPGKYWDPAKKCWVPGGENP